MYYVTNEIKYNKKLKSILSKNIKIEPYELNQDLLYFHGPKRAMVVGSAYEVLLQIEILKHKNSDNIRSLKYVRGLSLIDECVKLYSDENRKLAISILKEVEKQEYILYRYCKGDKIKLKYLLRAVFYLSFISEFRERNDIFNKKFETNKDDFKDLNQLRKGISSTLLKKLSKNENRFNLGVSAGYLAGEIDVLKGDKKIIDIKTTRDGIFSSDMLYQLIMYYFICKFNGININTISIYFARFGVEEKIKIKNLFIEKGEKKIKKYLKKRYKI